MSGTDGGGSPERPNVLVVFTDQQRWDTVGAYGSPLDLTPNLDDAAADGTVFEQATTSQPVCAPTRASLQTGQYATTHGVWRNGLVPETETTLAEAFDAAGYDTGYVGKWHLGGTGTDPRTDDWATRTTGEQPTRSNTRPIHTRASSTTETASASRSTGTGSTR